MSRLFKRGGVYWYDFSTNGVRYRQTTGTTKRREAEEVLDREKEAAKAGESIQKIKVYKVAELASEYIAWAQRQKSFTDKRQWVRELVEVFGNLDLKDLGTRVIEQWQSKRLKINKPATVNRKLATLKHMINKGVQWDMTTEDVLKKVRKVKLLPENNRRLRFLSVEECQRLIECCHKDLKPIVTVALNTGMRRGEILGLKWSQVDLNHGFILLTDTKNGERREIPINTRIEYLLKEMPRSVESVYVFAGKTGKPLVDIKKGFHTALRKAGINDFRFHDCRHTFASQLVMEGIDLTTIKELLGHKSLTMTLRYAHLAPGHKRRAVNVLDKLMQNSTDDALNQWHNRGTVAKTEKKRHVNGTKMAQFEESDKVDLS